MKRLGEFMKSVLVRDLRSDEVSQGQGADRARARQMRPPPPFTSAERDEQDDLRRLRAALYTDRPA